MKTVKVKFSINVPVWLYRYRWKNLKNYFSYQLRPYRCSDCGVKMPHKYGEVELNNVVAPMKARLTVSYHNWGQCLCQNCILKRLEVVESKPRFMETQLAESYNVEYECAVCKEEKPAFKAVKMSDGINDNMRFCTGASWNGNYVCLDCTKTALRDGVVKSSIYGRYKGKSVPTNGYGLPVVDGKVKFPE